MHGRSRTSRWRTSCAFSGFRPHPEPISPPMVPLPPNPQLQCFGLLMDLVPVHPIPRPSQPFGEFVISQTPESTEIVQATKLTPACGSSDSCAEPNVFRQGHKFGLLVLGHCSQCVTLPHVWLRQAGADRPGIQRLLELSVIPSRSPSGVRGARAERSFHWRPLLRLSKHPWSRRGQAGC
jgi:hypothetical protein